MKRETDNEMFDRIMAERNKELSLPLPFFEYVTTDSKQARTFRVDDVARIIWSDTTMVATVHLRSGDVEQLGPGAYHKLRYGIAAHFKVDVMAVDKVTSERPELPDRVPDDGGLVKHPRGCMCSKCIDKHAR